ncbi:MAG: ParB/RepB/Spo0J family partition protein [Eubacteriales bacterium]|nr:ParB/RepB/Spo0J family partition protein [Eubacteriales bacterium]
MARKSVKNRGLGRGLDALFQEQVPVVERAEEREEAAKAESQAAADDENRIIYIDINDIKPNENQPRKTFDKSKITELADSIKEHGVIQPLIVRKKEGSTGYTIVAGERRWRASHEAGLKQVPCIVRDLSEEENMLVAIIENLQRENLDSIEEAKGLQTMISDFGLTQEEVSKSVGKSRPYITNSLRLLKLPEDIRDRVSDGSISAGHARVILGIEGKKKQEEFCDKIIHERLSVREAEDMARNLKAGTKPTRAKRTKKKDPDTVRVESELSERLGTKVNIAGTGKKGKIEVFFYSDDDLDRLIELISAVN